MNKIVPIFSVWLACVLMPVFAQDAEPSHGDASVSDRGLLQIWNAEARQWQGPVNFWLAYAEIRGGLSWPQSSEYPPAERVKEHDTFMVELDTGVCLMEFYHERWRRARDVRRWSELLNTWGGCPDVFN